MNIAVCDDEKETRSTIISKIKSLLPDADIYEFPDGGALCGSGTAFDIIFLDIKMNGQDGMDAARALRRAGSRAVLIFVTALTDYVYEAFDVGAFHYLVKPIDNVKFFEVLNKAAEQLRESSAQGEPTSGRSIVVKDGRNRVRIALRDMIYAEVFNRKVIIHCVNGNAEYYGRIGDLEKQAGDGFFRPHRAYLVNLRYVVKYNYSEIFLENGVIPISKQKYAEFVKKYLEFLKDGDSK